MLFTLGLLLLLTPFPSFQSTSNDRRNTAGSEMTKPNAAFTLSKPKTTAAPPKQAARTTLKPNTVNQTALPAPATTKSKPSPSVIHTTPSVAVKSAPASGTIANKDKHTVAVNQTVSTKSPSAADVKVLRDRPATAGALNLQSASTKSASTHSTKTAKDKLQPVLNQTAPVKPPPASDAKSPKEKPAPTGGPTLHLASTKSASTSSFKTTKDKPQPVLNQTAPVKSASASDGKAAKDKPAPSVVHNVQSTSPKTGSASSQKAAKNKPAASVNQTVVDKSPSGSDAKKAAAVAAVPTKNTTAGGSAGASATAPKEKPATAQPIQVVVSDGCESGSSKEQELKLKPGAPLVMTHKISLLPGGCSGGCETEMAALKERVARLEREMFSIKNNCPCSASCPNDCSGNGECQKGKCSCQDGFTGPDCSKCVQGAECMKKAVKGKAKPAEETVMVQGEKEKSSVQEKATKGESSLSQGKEKKKGTEGGNTLSPGKEQKKGTEGGNTLSPGKQQKKTPDSKEADTKAKVATDAKVSLKTQSKQEVSTKKTPTRDSPGTAKTTRPTAAQVHLKHDRASQEESRKEKTVTASKKVQQQPGVKPVRDGSTSKAHSSSEQLKDEPRTNGTTTSVKTSSDSSKTVITLTKMVGAEKTKVESLERSGLPEKSGFQSAGQKNVKKVKVEATTSQSTDSKNTEANKTVKDAEDKVPHRRQDVVNATAVSTSSEGQDKTTIHGSGSLRVLGGSGLGSVKVANISSYSFTLMWSAPQGMFKNFTLVRTELLSEGTQIDHEEFDEEALEEVKTYTVKNTTARVQLPTESSNATLGSGSRGKAETRRISMVIPGNVRSVEFSNLRPNAAYALQIYGSTAQRRSKVHRVTVVTGPEPATEMVFSNVTESSLSVSWTKPKTTYAAFRITYTNIITGDYQYVTVSSHQSHVVLAKLSAGTSYIVSIMATQGRAQSDALTSIITTVPAPPTHLRAVNVTDTKALLQWTPSLGKVDRFIISYESSKTPNVTVTVMLAGNSVEHQLRGLQRGTVYTVKVLSQKNSHQSMAVSTTFTTANLVKAEEVSARYAIIAWRSSTVVYHSYRLVYQVAGEETKEVILDGTMTDYKLTGLLPMSRYIVLVQGEREGRYTSIVTTEFITGKLRFPFPADCSQELLNGALESGEVDIYPLGKEGRSVRVYCDMETDGGGWTVFQRRLNGKTDFYRTWSEYSAGFGNLSEEFWLGNDVLYNLTSVGPMSLRVDMQYGNDTVYAHYANFSVDSKERHYALTVSGYTGTAGDSMRYHNGRPFSAWDKNPDPLGIHCARAYMGGWWYKNCYKTNLNGLYGTNQNNQGIVWIDWKGKDVSIPFTEMKFRPSRFSPATHG